MYKYTANCTFVGSTSVAIITTFLKIIWKDIFWSTYTWNNEIRSTYNPSSYLIFLEIHILYPHVVEIKKYCIYVFVHQYQSQHFFQLVFPLTLDVKIHAYYFIWNHSGDEFWCLPTFSSSYLKQDVADDV